AAAKFDQFRGAGAMEFQAWLVAIARYEALDLLRYWHQDARNKAREQPLAAVSALGQQVADDSSGPAEKASRRERAARLLAALERLPPDYQEVLRLRNSESLGFAKVAALMGRSDQAVRQLWMRAIKRLRDELGEDP